MVTSKRQASKSIYYTARAFKAPGIHGGCQEASMSKSGAGLRRPLKLSRL
jgi:hypothetical protein